MTYYMNAYADGTFSYAFKYRRHLTRPAFIKGNRIGIWRIKMKDDGKSA